MRTILLALTALIPAAGGPVVPTVYRGVWGVSQQECARGDKSVYNTTINLTRIDQSDNRCRLHDIEVPGDEITAKMRCDVGGRTYDGLFKMTPAEAPDDAIVMDMRGDQFAGGHRTVVLVRCQRP